MSSTLPPSSRGRLKLAFAGFLLAFAAGLVGWNLLPVGGGAGGQNLAHFTCDDGKTLFAAAADNIPPFLHDGQQACRAFVFTCDAGATRWTGYLQRYTPRGQEIFRKLIEARKRTGHPEINTELVTCSEVKRPNDSAWARESDFARAATIITPKCPHAGAHQPELVPP